MNNPQVIVVGAGISGLSFAWNAAMAGRKALVLEERNRIGGCIYSCRFEDGYWYELGAHTVYNSYSSLLDIAKESGLADTLIQRGPARAHFGLLKNGEIDWLTPPRILLRLNWLEAARHAPIGFFRSKRGRSLSEYYSSLFGPGNFRRVFSPFFAAVPSQRADDFPAEGPGSLFKKRDRCKEFPRSFGFPGGLQALCNAIAANPNIEVRMQSKVTWLRASKDDFILDTEDGNTLKAGVLAIATPHKQAEALLQNSYADLSNAIGRIETVRLESLGARIERSKCRLPECAFVVPADDIFYSAVTRDPFPDANWRAFAFHFRPGFTRQQKIQCICDLLRVSPSDLDGVEENHAELPAPRVNHAGIVASIQKQLNGSRLALMGNYITGLAIEDCILRAFGEWLRVQRYV
jgi:UDP-galactopyranose mutase